MFCLKCGAKVIEGAVFCEKCGAKLMTVAENSVEGRPAQTDMSETADPMASESSKAVGGVLLEIAKPDKQMASGMQSFNGMSGQTVSQTENTYEPVLAGDIYGLLRERAQDCPEIKKVDFQQKSGITTLKGKKNRYFVGYFNGFYKLSVCPVFLLSIHRVIFWFAICFTLFLLAEGGDLEEIYPLIGGCLLIGGVGGIISEVICRGERKKIAPYIQKSLSKAVCIKDPVAPVMEPLLSHPRMWFLGLPLSAASITQPIFYSAAALAGTAVLLVSSGALDRAGNPGYMQSSYNAYDDGPKSETDLPSSGSEGISLGKTYTDEKEGFSFMYPSDWDIAELSPDALVSVACIGAYGTNALIIVEKDIADDAYFTAEKSDFKDLYSSMEGFSNVSIMDLSEIELDGCPARKLTFAADNDNGVHLIWTQYFYIRGSYMYAVTCIVEESDYDKYVPVFYAVADSYVIAAADGGHDASEMINSYEGSWHGLEYVNDRMFMEISYVDANGGYFDISISWSDSASEWTQWELQGVYTEEGVMQYYGNEIEYGGSYETVEIEENVVSEAEEGVLWIGDDGLLYWDDYTEPSGETYAFEKSVY